MTAETRRYRLTAIPAQSKAQPRLAVVAGTVMEIVEGGMGVLAVRE
jgi:hypothetical protein